MMMCSICIQTYCMQFENNNLHVTYIIYVASYSMYIYMVNKNNLAAKKWPGQTKLQLKGLI